ncbi:hypothetical protein VP1G_11036 [Cytospora mali]|uniref:Uncharacterized protein n=1 Tax=Cytospora mali TaxID=578113 RepID=A0A194V4E0_CYTMA|nr:hypothetical protein VP1G_11036 [Valsa mali var. pyri (nom. inval.)]
MSSLRRLFLPLLPFRPLPTSPASAAHPPTRTFFYVGPAAAASALALDTRPPVIEVILAGLYVLIYPLRDGQEGLLDVLAGLGAGLDVAQDAVLPRPGRGLLGGDLALLVGQVGLVADEDDDDVGLGDLAQVVEPVGHVEEGRLPAEVEDEEGARGAPEVGPRDGLSESFMCFWGVVSFGCALGGSGRPFGGSGGFFGEGEEDVDDEGSSGAEGDRSDEVDSLLE